MDKLDLFRCIRIFVEENFPRLDTRLSEFDSNATQIRIDDPGPLVAIYEKWPHKIFYIAHSSERTPLLGRRGPNDAWNIVECDLGDPEYFKILTQAIKAAQFNKRKGSKL